MSAPYIGPAIVGRRRELGALRSWLDTARDGAGRLVLYIGEPGIGKTRLAQELAGLALAAGTAVAWGRCVEAEGAPPFWPWRQVFRSLGIDADSVLAGDVESPGDRFRVFDGVTEAVRRAIGPNGLVIVLDDIHWGDEPSLLVLRHLADQISDTRLLVVATFRDVEPAGVLPRVLPDLLRSPGVERLHLRGLGLEEVREQLASVPGVDRAADPRAVLDLTGGNPLFVRELARAMADGTWRPDRPPRTVLDIVRARLDRASAECQELVQAAAIVGRDFSLPLVSAVLRKPVGTCLPLVDEAIAHGLIDQFGDGGDYRFVHALTREAVEASLTTTDRIALHRAVAEGIEAIFAGDLSEHLSDLARHWAVLAPYGEAATARTWTIRAAEDAVRRLAYEEGGRLYRTALALGGEPLPDIERAQVLIALARAAHIAGDLLTSREAAVAAADAAKAAMSKELVGEAALALEVTADPAGNTVAEQLCEQALDSLGDRGQEALRARLLAHRAHLAFYDGDQDRVERLSAAALGLARSSGDPRALVEALHARKEACPGPAGRGERLALASEMLALAPRTGSARTAMWGELWRIEALMDGGELALAAEGLATLQAAVDRVGGPVSAWHFDRMAGGIAQAQARYTDALMFARRGFERMRNVEPGPARGTYFGLLTALSGHIGIADELVPFLREPFHPLPRFITFGRVSRSFLLLQAGRFEEAAVSFEQAGPINMWSPPAFLVVPCYVYAALAAVELGQDRDLPVLLDLLEAYRGAHATGDGLLYLGPVELALGRVAAARGQLDRGIDDLAVAAEQADRAGAPGYGAEARYHLAAALVGRDRPGDHERAVRAAGEADRRARALGMVAYVERTRALVAHLGGSRRTELSRRELEVAVLVAEGLTNRQIAEHLVISERTAQNHVQHILTKLGFNTRSQIAAWSAGLSR